MNQNQKIVLNVEGMTCSNCAATVTKALQKKGLESVSVSFIDKEVSFLMDDNNNLKDISKSIADLGYQVVKNQNVGQISRGFSLLEKKFYLSLFFTLPLFLTMWLPFHWLHQPITQLLLCLPVFIIGLLHFGKSAWGSLKMGVPNMDVLILVGSVSAFIYSLFGMILFDDNAIHNFLFFETAATIITLVLLGNLIEERAVRKTGSALRELASLKPEKAILISMQDGQENMNEVDASTLLKFDLIQVNTGDKIAVDGIIISGEASIDESFLTGESIPVEKKQGDNVIGGTIVSNGQLKIRASKVGNDTVLSQIIDLVKKAQHEKPAIQKLGDRVSAIFVPVVLLIACLTFVLAHFVFGIASQQAFLQSIAVLVISCPCAMGLATPTAVMSGIGRAAKNGILIKGGNTLENFAQVKTIVFDKTGTLTSGKFRIKSLEILGEEEKSMIENLIFSLELNSSHPIAQSLVSELKTRASKIEFNSFVEEKGSGVSANDSEGNKYFLGHSRNLAGTIENASALVLLKNRKVIAHIFIEDEIKESALTCLQKLNALGIKTVVLSGDSKEKCEELAKKLPLSEIFSEKNPSQKLQIIKELSSQGSIAMVGDGINDAPALSTADVGISLSNASAIAINSAQVILLNGENLNDIVLAFQLSKHTLMTIKQNLFWAFFYNVIAIPVAAFGFLSPMVAALSMAFSDVMVIGNSIRLKTKKLN